MCTLMDMTLRIDGLGYNIRHLNFLQCFLMQRMANEKFSHFFLGLTYFFGGFPPTVGQIRISKTNSFELIDKFLQRRDQVLLLLQDGNMFSPFGPQGFPTCLGVQTNA